MARAIWWAAIIAGASFMLAVTTGIEGPAVIAWKGAGVGLLALWAGWQTREHELGRDGWLITAVMAFGALGDVLIDAVGLTAGGAAFAVGHVVAIILYQLNRRDRLSPSQQALGLVMIPLAIVITIGALGAPGEVLERLGRDMMTERQSNILGVLIYAALVAAMASAAWTSRFPRYRTGLGAVLFLVSDLLIFARMGALAGSPLPGLLIWPLYFAGQVLILWGVVSTLIAEGGGQDDPLHHRL